MRRRINDASRSEKVINLTFGISTIRWANTRSLHIVEAAAKKGGQWNSSVMTYADSLFRYGRSDSPSTAAWAKGNAWTSVIACWPQFNELSLEKAESRTG